MIAGKRVVVSGIIPGLSQGQAKALVQDHGAFVQSGMPDSTEILITGGKPGPKKIEKAKALGIPVITWEEMLVGLNGNGGTVEESEAAPEQLTGARTVSPQFALAGDLPTGDEWFYEVKWDGYRCIATVRGGEVAMQSRSGSTEYVDQFPKIAAELAKLPDCILDGELIVVGADGKTSFETAHTAATGMEAYLVFDALDVEGVDIRREPLWQRREGIKVVLEHLHPERASEMIVRISPARDDGAELMQDVIKQGLEGVVAKRKNARYVEGSRTSDWIKTKVRLAQEFAVLGWKPGSGRRAGMAGSILLGVRKDDKWTFVGRVGTGGEDRVWQNFTHLQWSGEEDTRTWDLTAATKAELRDVAWVDPVCVVQVEFQRWTADGRLWHPSLQRLRDDKDPFTVVRET